MASRTWVITGVGSGFGPELTQRPANEHLRVTAWEPAAAPSPPTYMQNCRIPRPRTRGLTCRPNAS
jgi:hypothetical protein